MDNIQKFMNLISKNQNPDIKLLRNEEVVRWIFGDTSFLPEIEKKNKTEDTKKNKVNEDNWGRSVMKRLRPDLTLDKQWTNIFGECIAKEIYMLMGKVVTKPSKKNNFQPDLEVDDYIIEVKAQTFYTTGTAGEKILGCPFKYAEIPSLYGKPLKIICIGGAEKECREKFRNLGGNCSAEKKKFLDFYRENGFEFIAASDILSS